MLLFKATAGKEKLEDQMLQPHEAKQWKIYREL